MSCVDRFEYCFSSEIMIQEKLNLKRDKYNIQEYNGSPTVQKFPHHFV